MYFFTATINNWQKLLTDDSLKDIIINSLEWLHNNSKVHIHGFVLMPNHIHLLWSGSIEYKIETAEHDLLSFTGHEIKKYLLKNNPAILYSLQGSPFIDLYLTTTFRAGFKTQIK